MSPAIHTSAATHARAVTLTLDTPDELFVGSAPGQARTADIAPEDWDAVGALLGEPGVHRLMRLLYGRRDAEEIVIRLRADPLPSPERSTRVGEAEALVARLRAWMTARALASRSLVRTSRAVGARALAIAVLLLGLILSLAWLFQQDSPLGPPGPLRLLIAEALVIAGWVVMWRPVELLVFDPLRPTLERRILERALRLPIRIEWTVGPSGRSAPADPHAA